MKQNQNPPTWKVQEHAGYGKSSDTAAAAAAGSVGTV